MTMFLGILAALAAGALYALILHWLVKYLMDKTL